MTDIRVVIPARYASSRLPGKPLCDIAGKPLIVRVWERAMEAGAYSVTIATDDERIATAAKKAGADVVLTRKDHQSGTDRLAEVARQRKWSGETIVVNLQGDEPLIPSEILQTLANALVTHSHAGIATAAAPIRTAQDLFTPSIVKVVMDQHRFALYFSRAPIPWSRDQFGDGIPQTLPPETPYFRHVGLYAYRVSTLEILRKTQPSTLEIAESLEQLRALSLGLKIHVSLLKDAPPHGVDTPEDLKRVRRLYSNS